MEPESVDKTSGAVASPHHVLMLPGTPPAAAQEYQSPKPEASVAPSQPTRDTKRKPKVPKRYLGETEPAKKKSKAQKPKRTARKTVTIHQYRRERKRLDKLERRQREKGSGPNVVATTHGGDAYYEMESVVGRRIQKGKVEYLIRWKGCPESDNTWEPTSNLCDTAMAAALKFAREDGQRQQKRREDEQRLGLHAMDEDSQVPQKDARHDLSAKVVQTVVHQDRGSKVIQDDVDPTFCSKMAQTPTDVEPSLKDSPQNSHTNIAAVAENGALSRERIDQVDDNWHWNDEEQVTFRDVERINVHSQDARHRVTEARENGIPVVLRGHVGWANFAKRWLSTPGTSGDTLLVCNEARTEAAEWLDLSKPHQLNIDSLIQDIGSEDVPVVRRNYDEADPIQGTISAAKFLTTCWPIGGETSNGKSSSTRFYLHQWQFPLSDTAGRKLCHQNNPLPNDIFGEDLLKYWLDLPQCRADCPLQYLFMGREQTVSKLHRDPGGLAISIAPIVGEKECVLVHRMDGIGCLYHLEANVDKIDLHSFPLMAHARVWKTTIRPGEILLMPQGTYHQCRNVTPCLSYSRFHLDTVNLYPFLQSMIDGDAQEVEHDWVLWNSASELIRKVDAMADEARAMLKANKPPTPLTANGIKLVDTLRALRNIVREVARRKAIHDAVRASKKKNHGAEKKEGPKAWHSDDNPDHDWNKLVDDIDVSLHEFRYRNMRKMPRIRLRRTKGSGNAAATKDLTPLKTTPTDLMGDTDPALDAPPNDDKSSSQVASHDTDLERAFLSLPRGTPVDSQTPSNTSNIAVGDEVMVQFQGNKMRGTILDVEEGMPFAFLAFEELSSLYDEHLPYEELRIPVNGGTAEVRRQDVRAGTILIHLEGSNHYRGTVQSTTCDVMFRVRLNVRKCPMERWLTREAILDKVSHGDDEEAVLDKVSHGDDEEAKAPRVSSSDVGGAPQPVFSTPRKTRAPDDKEETNAPVLSGLEVGDSSQPVASTEGEVRAPDDREETEATALSGSDASQPDSCTKGESKAPSDKQETKAPTLSGLDVGDASQPSIGETVVSKREGKVGTCVSDVEAVEPMPCVGVEQIRHENGVSLASILVDEAVKKFPIQEETSAQDPTSRPDLNPVDAEKSSPAVQADWI